MVPQEGIPYPPEEQKADRKAGRHAARTWTPRDPRQPDPPPPAVQKICGEILAAVLAEYQTHVKEIDSIDADLAAAEVRVEAGAVATGSDAAISATGYPPTDGAADHNKYRAFDLARDKQLQREATAAHAKNREHVARLRVQRASAERDYRLIFAAHATKGVRRIRTVLGEVLTRHQLRNQLESLDQRCIDELNNTIKMLSAFSKPDFTGGDPLQPDVKE